MKFSILIPTLGKRIDETRRLLDSLSKQTFQQFEVVIVTQINHSEIERLILDWPEMEILHIKLEKKGLSYARNSGLKICSGDWVIISDDDCWYPTDALMNISNIIKNGSPDIILSQIYDPIMDTPYKTYSLKSDVIKNKLSLMSKSSIEIAFNRSRCCIQFDELFGLGSDVFVCGEEVDFLLNNFKDKEIRYCPIVTVYHQKKCTHDSAQQIIAKGAIYAKHFNIFISIAVLMRDLFKKGENNWKPFWKGYMRYRRIKN